MKYNLNAIMTAAHGLRKQYNITLSKALQMAWAGVKSGITYQDWKANKIAAMVARNKRYAFKVAYDVSPLKYLATRKAVQAQGNCDVEIDTLDFQNM